MRSSLPSPPGPGPVGRVLRRVAVVATTVGVMLTVAAVPAYADYYSGGMPSRSFNFKTQGINNIWVGHYDTARARWNNSTAGASIGRTSSAAATATAARYSQSWYGLYEPHGIRWLNRTFTIRVNARTLGNDAGSNLTAWILSTTTHELGHALSLADNPNTSLPSLMKHSRNRTTVGFPTAYDTSEVRRIYS